MEKEDFEIGNVYKWKNSNLTKERFEFVGINGNNPENLIFKSLVEELFGYLRDDDSEFISFNISWSEMELA